MPQAPDGPAASDLQWGKHQEMAPIGAALGGRNRTQVDAKNRQHQRRVGAPLERSKRDRKGHESAYKPAPRQAPEPKTAPLRGYGSHRKLMPVMEMGPVAERQTQRT